MSDQSGSKLVIQFSIFLALIFLFSAYEGGFERAARATAGIFVIGGTSWIVFHLLVRWLKGVALDKGFWSAFAGVALSSIVLLLLKRGEFVIIAAIPGAILGASAYMTRRNK